MHNSLKQTHFSPSVHKPLSAQPLAPDWGNIDACQITAVAPWISVYPIKLYRVPGFAALKSGKPCVRFEAVGIKNQAGQVISCSVVPTYDDNTPRIVWADGLHISAFNIESQETFANSLEKVSHLQLVPKEIPSTTEFPNLMGRVLVLADCQNLSYFLRNRGLDCDFKKLLNGIKAASPRANIHAHTYSRLHKQEEVEYARDYFLEAGWNAECKLAPEKQGAPRVFNSDNDILLAGGYLVSKFKPHHTVLCTGDGDLGCDFADSVAGWSPSTQLHIISNVGSTSSRLLACNNPSVISNTWIGRDCIDQAQ